MNLAAGAPLWLALVYAGLLAAAGVEDAIRLRISNITCALIALAAVLAAIVAGPELSFWKNLSVSLGLLLVGMPLFAAGKVGGGDVKLFASAALWFDLLGALQFIGTALVAGGVLSLLVLALRRFRWRDGVVRRVSLLKRGSGIPYGLAVASGALMTMAILRG